VLVESLRISDFRNVALASITPDERFNVFVGPNGQGKTNLLESIYVLGALKSFRAFRNRDLIRQGADVAVIEADVDRGGVRRQARVTVRPNGRRVEINNKNVANLRDFFGTFNALVFSPEDIGVLRGAPADRRLFFDRMIFHAQPAFATESGDYDNVLRSRNATLRQEEPDRSLLAVYDEQLGRLGARIVMRRLELLRRIHDTFTETFAEIFAAGHAPSVVYAPDGLGGLLLPDLEKYTEEELALHLARQLRRLTSHDIARGHTTVGPHRDDFDATLETNPVRTWASQGQHRAFALSLKITEIKLLRAQLGYDPVLLLDDVSSELDPVRNQRLFDFLSGLDGQVFITTTDLAYVRLSHPFTRWQIEAGKVVND
jgi:DNA replication and repair protein RecF